MKSFFDFIGRSEATRGARRWSWTFLEVKYKLSYLIKTAWRKLNLQACLI
ncbi:hypothetical protein [Mesobacillus selenatarsenatis]|nr:hypothetical protein [Mesobacillus selenatarsenatis]